MKKILIIVILLFGFKGRILCLDSLNQVFIQYVREIPESLNTDIVEITNYLSNKVETEYEKAEIAFYWIANYIDYDIEGYIEKSYHSDYKNTLLVKKGVCGHFTKLYKELCTRLGVTCYEVRGYAKGFNHREGDYFPRTNHSWNIVKIADEYLFLDPTWGSGSIDYGLSYNKGIDKQEVLVNSDQFRSTHLPADPRWQLSDKIVDMEGFIWNTDYQEMLNKSTQNIDYKARIIEFDQLDEIDQEIASLEGESEFYRTDNNYRKLAQHYYSEAYRLSTGKFDQDKLSRAIKYYDRAINKFEELKIAFPELKQTIEEVKKSKEYTLYRLESKK